MTRFQSITMSCDRSNSMRFLFFLFFSPFPSLAHTVYSFTLACLHSGLSCNKCNLDSHLTLRQEEVQNDKDVCSNRHIKMSLTSAHNYIINHFMSMLNMHGSSNTRLSSILELMWPSLLCLPALFTPSCFPTSVISHLFDSCTNIDTGGANKVKRV